MSNQYDTIPRAIELPGSEFTARGTPHSLTPGLKSGSFPVDSTRLLHALVMELGDALEVRNTARVPLLFTTLTQEFRHATMSVGLEPMPALIMWRNGRIAPLDQRVAARFSSFNEEFNS